MKFCCRLIFKKNLLLAVTSLHLIYSPSAAAICNHQLQDQKAETTDLFYRQQIEDFKREWQAAIHGEEDEALNKQNKRLRLGQLSQLAAELSQSNPLFEIEINKILMGESLHTPLSLEEIDNQIDNLVEQLETLEEEASQFRNFHPLKEQAKESLVPYRPYVEVVKPPQDPENEYARYVDGSPPGKEIMFNLRKFGGHLKFGQLASSRLPNLGSGQNNVEDSTIIGAMRLKSGNFLSWGERSLIHWKRDFITYNPQQKMRTLRGELETGPINSILELANGDLLVIPLSLTGMTYLAWDIDKMVAQYSFGQGFLEKDMRLVKGAKELKSGKLVTWSKKSSHYNDHSKKTSLVIWQKKAGKFQFSQSLGVDDNQDENLGHTSEVDGALELPNGDLFTYDMNNTFIHWRLMGGEYHLEKVIKPYLEQKYPENKEQEKTNGIRILEDGSLIAWTSFNRLIYFIKSEGSFAVGQVVDAFKHLNEKVKSIVPLEDGDFATVSYENIQTPWQDQLVSEFASEIAKIQEEIRSLESSKKKSQNTNLISGEGQ